MLIFLGDTHGRHDHVIRIAECYRPAAMAHVGDFGLNEPFAETFAAVRRICPLYFVAGNHDFDSDACYDNLFSGTEDYNLHARVLEVGGLRVAGLGGNFQGKVWMPPDTPQFSNRKEFLTSCGRGNRWRDGLPRKRRGAIWREDYDRLARIRADVLVAHEAPGCHRRGFEALGDLAWRMGVERVFHGHLHEQYSGAIAGIAVHGIGLCGAVDIDGAPIDPGAPESYKT